MNSAHCVTFSSIPLFPPPQTQISSSPPVTPLAQWETFQMKLYVTVCITATTNSPFPESISCTEFHTQPSLHWPGYRLHVPGIVVRFLAWQGMFVSTLCRQALWPTLPATQWALRLKQLGLEARHNVVPNLRMSGATSPLPQYAFMACTGIVTFSSSIWNTRLANCTP